MAIVQLPQIEKEIFVSPVQFTLPPYDIKIERFNKPVLDGPRRGDIISRILDQSQQSGKYVAVSLTWLAEQLVSAKNAIRQDNYEFDSPLARDMCGVNSGQIFDTTLTRLTKTGLATIVTNELQDGKPKNVLYLTPSGLGEYLVSSH